MHVKAYIRAIINLLRWKNECHHQQEDASNCLERVPRGLNGCLERAGEYVTKDVGPEYLELLEKSVRTKDRSRPGRQLSLNGAPPAVAAIASTAA